jgi:hypothetical protein
MSGARRGRGELLLGLLLLALAATEWKGYRFGGSHHAIQVPFVKHLADPSLYRSDALLQSLPGYVSAFLPAMAGLTRLFGDVEPAYFVVYVAFHWLTLAALFALAFHFTRSLGVGLLACLLYLGQAQSLGGAVSYWPRLTHSHPAVAMLLWAFYLHFRGRRVAALAVCGIAFNVHALYAAHVAFLLLFDCALDWLRRERPLPWGEAVAFLLPALPTVALLASRSEAIPGPELPVWLEVMRDRSGQHTFPLTAPPAVYARYLSFLALGGLALAVADARTRRAVLRLGAGVLLLCAAGFVFAEWVPLAGVIKAQLLRSTKWLTLLLLAPIARLLAESWAWGGMARLGAALAFLGILLREPAWLVAALLVYVLGAWDRWPASASLLATGAAFVAAFTGAAPWPERLGLPLLGAAAQSLSSDPLVMGCLFLFVVLRLALAAARPPWARAATAAVLLAATVGVAPAILRGAQAAQRAEPWNDVQAWVRGHVPVDAVILTPPYLEGFRVFSERATVGEWKDGTQQFFSWTFTRGWLERMREMKGSTRAFDRFPADRLLELARKHAASYLVCRASAELPFPRLYANPEFAVYELPLP